MKCEQAGREKMSSLLERERILADFANPVISKTTFANLCLRLRTVSSQTYFVNDVGRAVVDCDFVVVTYMRSGAGCLKSSRGLIPLVGVGMAI